LDSGVAAQREVRKMPVYRLTPVQGTENSPQWRASSIRPHCLWIVARDEIEARREVAKATCSEAIETLAPWKDSELVSCEYDETKNLAKGIICVRTTPVRTAARRPEQRLSA
jgi:hypothetical protein